MAPTPIPPIKPPIKPRRVIKTNFFVCPAKALRNKLMALNILFRVFIRCVGGGESLPVFYFYFYFFLQFLISADGLSFDGRGQNSKEFFAEYTILATDFVGFN